MHNQTLKHLLHRLKSLETFIIWGSEDNIVPIDSGRIYSESIPGSVLDVMNGLGHRPEIEDPDEFTTRVLKFLK